jgi:tubulin--tyrosine ligase-like protein 12
VTTIKISDRDDHLNPSYITRTNSKIELTKNTQDADVLYLIEHTYGQGEALQEVVKKDKMLNQFWWEGLLVTKESLANTMKLATKQEEAGKAHNEEDEGFLYRGYFPISFNLSDPKELAEFVLTKIFYSKFASSIQLQDPNSSSDGGGTVGKDVYILKSFKGKQSIDYPITTSTGCALRHLETAPRLACRYVTSPLLYGGKKFDLRYYVAVKSMEPLVLARHMQYAIRTANEEYSMENFESFQKHFTAMNFIDGEEGK